MNKQTTSWRTWWNGYSHVALNPDPNSDS